MTELRPSTQPLPLGKSGLTVSPLAWGMWRFAGEVAPARALIEAALEAGITLFDTADVYGFDGSADSFGSAEALLGRVLAESPGLRERMTIATKGGITPPVPYDSSADYLARALDASLRRMGVERVALYQIHRPDMLAHPQEVAGALARMVESGKVAAVGVSNHRPAQATALQSYLPFPLASHQPELSPLATAPLFDGVLDQAMECGMAVLAWSPLGGGRLGGGHGDARAVAVAALLDTKAGACGVGRAAVAYSWIMTHPARPIPIVGTQDPKRIAESADALRVGWSRAEWYAVLEAGMGEKLP